MIGTLRYDYVDGTGAVTTVDQDLTDYVIQAYLPDESEPAGFAVVEGTGAADGRFQIDGVPDGADYYLKVVAPGSGGARFYVTDDHSPDLGRPVAGRPDAVSVVDPTAVTFQLAGMTPWQGDARDYYNDFLVYESFNVGTETWQFDVSSTDQTSWPTWDQTATDFAIDWRTAAWSWRLDGRPAENDAGDPIYVTHHRTSTVADSWGRKQTITRTIDWLQAANVTIHNGQAATVTGTFAPVAADRNFRLTFNRPAWEATYSDGLSGSGTSFISMQASPYDQNLILGADAFSVAFDNRSGNVNESTTSVEVSYGDPYPDAWVRRTYQQYQRTRSYKLPGTTIPRVSFGGTTRVMELASPYPATPDLQPVGTVTVEGQNGLAGGAFPFDGVAPVSISWSAVATANHYEVRVWRVYVDGSRTRTQSVASLSTKDTGIEIPAEVFTGGQFWTFTVATIRNGDLYGDGRLDDRGFPYTEATLPIGQFRLSAACGNGSTDLGEDCDGESASCDVDCTTAVCGDGIRNALAGEVCDSVRDSFACDSDCTTNVCGDGLVNPTTEDCDDGNTTNDNNGCSPTCRAGNSCGDGRVEHLREECDDGNEVDDGNGCSATCRRNRGSCGDDVIQAGVEACDPPTGNASCDDDCTANQCLDGFVNWNTENCDDGDLDEGNGCPNNCLVTTELCRDGIDNDANGFADCSDPVCAAGC